MKGGKKDGLIALGSSGLKQVKDSLELTNRLLGNDISDAIIRGVDLGSRIKENPEGFQVWSTESDWEMIGDGPYVLGGTLIFDTSDSIRSLSIKDGKESWRFDFDGSSGSKIILSKDRLILTAANDCYCINSRTGTLIWKYEGEGPASSWNSSLDATDTTVFFAYTNYIVSLDMNSGELISTFTFPRIKPYGRLKIDTIRSQIHSKSPGANIVTDQQTLYCVKNGVLQCFDLTLNNLRWQKNLAKEKSLSIYNDHTLFLADRNRLYVGDRKKETIEYLNSIDGSNIWTSQLDGTPYFFKVIDETIYVKCDDEFLYAFNSEKGELKWQFDTKDEGGYGPHITEHGLFIASNDSIVMLTLDGEEMWRFKTKTPVTCEPIEFGGILYFGCLDGYFYSVKFPTSS